MIKVAARIVITSHLSDSQECMARGEMSKAYRHVNFAKWLVGRHADTNDQVDADAEWDLFVNTKWGE